MNSRVFISIDIPDNLKKEIIKLQNSFPEFVGKKTESENLHLTLKFLGEIDEEKLEEVKEKLEEIELKEFETEIDSIGFFSPDLIRIIWLHLSTCEELQKKVDSVLEGLFAPEKRFMSHVTIARVKSVKDKNKFIKELKGIKPVRIKFMVKDFKLKRSVLKQNGPEYEDLEVYTPR